MEDLEIKLIIGWFGLEGTFQGYLKPPLPWDIVNWTRLFQAPSSLDLNISRGDVSTTSLGSLIFLKSNLNLPSLV